MNRRINYLIPRQLWLTLGLAAVNLVIIFLTDGICDADDTPTYIGAVDNVLNRGYDHFRSTGYPLLIALWHKLLGIENWRIGVVATQAAAFMLSIIVLWHLLRSASRSGGVATVIAIYYSLAPGISTFVTSILTESLSISCAVFLVASVYLILRREEVNRWAPWVMFCSLVALFMLRPASVALFGALGVAVVGVFVLRRRCKWVVALLAGASLMAPFYQYFRTSRELGVITSSTVTLINRYNVVCRTGVNFSPDSTDNPRLKQLLVEFNAKPDRNTYYDCKMILLLCGAPAMDSLLNRYHSPWPGFGTRVKTALTDYHLLYGREYYNHDGPYTPFKTKRSPFALFRYWLVPLTLLAGCVIFFRQWKRDRALAWIVLFLLAMLSAVALSAVLYAPDSFERLSLPGSPAMLALWALCCGPGILLPAKFWTKNKNKI